MQSERFKWTPENEQEMLRLWDSGMTATAIAQYFGGGLTRNAVLGKAHRMRNRKQGAVQMKPRSVGTGDTPREATKTPSPKKPRKSRAAPALGSATKVRIPGNSVGRPRPKAKQDPAPGADFGPSDKFREAKHFAAFSIDLAPENAKFVESPGFYECAWYFDAPDGRQVACGAPVMEVQNERSVQKHYCAFHAPKVISTLQTREKLK